MNVHYNYNFQFAVPWSSLCNIPFSGTYSKLISFNQGSSQVVILDLLDFVPNKYKRVLWQKPINVQTLNRGFWVWFKLQYKGFLFFVCLFVLFFFQENVILKTSFCKMKLCAWENLTKM